MLSGMDPSPASAVSVEEASKVSWSLDAFCIEEDQANEAATIIEREAPGVRAAVEKLDDKDWVAVSLAGLPAVHAGPFVVAGWHELAHLEGGKIPVWIEAGPAFGTGASRDDEGLPCRRSAVELKRKRPQRGAGYRHGVWRAGAGGGEVWRRSSRWGRTWTRSPSASRRRTAKNNQARGGSAEADACARDSGHRSDADAHAPYDLVLANILARPLVSLAPEIAKLVKPRVAG